MVQRYASPVVWFCVVTSLRCHTLGLKRWNGLCYTRDNSVTTKVLLSRAWLIVYLLIISSVTTWQQKIIFTGREQVRFPLFAWLSFALPACSATPLASEVGGLLPHGFTLALARASPAVKHSAPPPEAWVSLCCGGSGGGRAGESIYSFHFYSCPSLSLDAFSALTVSYSNRAAHAYQWQGL